MMVRELPDIPSEPTALTEEEVKRLFVILQCGDKEAAADLLKSKGFENLTMLFHDLRNLIMGLDVIPNSDTGKFIRSKTLHLFSERVNPFAHAKATPILGSLNIAIRLLRYQFPDQALADIENREENSIVIAYEAQLMMAFQNLLINAAKYGLEDVPIRISLESDEKEVSVLIKNRSQHPLPTKNPFEKGKRGDHGISGEGLGLTNVQKDLANFSGSITLEQHAIPEGYEITARVTLPKAVLSEKIPNVLIVEETEHVRSILKLVLSNENVHEIEVPINPEDPLPDILFVDDNFGKNEALIREIRQNKEEVLVILMLASLQHTPDDLLDKVVQKPFSINSISDIIRTWKELHKEYITL